MSRYVPTLPLRNVAKDPGTLAHLHSLGAFPKINQRFVFPGDGTAGALLRHIDTEMHPVFADVSSFYRYKKARRSIGAQNEDVPDSALLLLVREFGPNVPMTILTQRLGGQASEQKRKARIRDLTGMTKSLPGPITTGDLEQLLSILPASMKGDLLRALATKTLPAIPNLSATHIGQICALETPEVRILGALALLSSCLHRRSHAHRQKIISAIKRMDRIINGASGSDARNAVLLDYLEGRSIPGDNTKIRSEMPETIAWLRRLATDVGPKIGRTLDAEFPGLIIRISKPKVLRPQIKAELATELTESTVLQSRDLRSNPDERPPEVQRRLTLLRVAPQIIHSVRERIDELERVANRFRSIREHCQKGRGIFSVELEGSVNIDGSAGRPRRAPFSFIHSSMLYDELVSGAVPGWRKGTPEPPPEKTYLCISQDPHPDDAWFAQLMRTRAIASQPSGIAELDEQRQRMFHAGALPAGRSAPSSLLDFERPDRKLARHASRVDIALVPIVEFYHAMLMAALVIMYGLRFGARIGETMQIRLGSDCMDEDEREGRTVHILRLIPKGAHTATIFQTDPEIRTIIRQIVRLAHSRWFPQCYRNGEIDLPVVRYGNRARQNIPDGKFILRNEKRALSGTHLAMFIKVLLFGLVDMKSHDGRYVIATIMSVLGYDVDETGSVLHHAPGSREAEVYDLSEYLSNEEIEEIRRELRSAGIMGKVA